MFLQISGSGLGPLSGNARAGSTLASDLLCMWAWAPSEIHGSQQPMTDQAAACGLAHRHPPGSPRHITTPPTPSTTTFPPPPSALCAPPSSSSSYYYYYYYYYYCDPWRCPPIPPSPPPVTNSATARTCTSTTEVLVELVPLNFCAGNCANPRGQHRTQHSAEPQVPDPLNILLIYRYYTGGAESC